jgi:hypothetical protein
VTITNIVVGPVGADGYASVTFKGVGTDSGGVSGYAMAMDNFSLDSGGGRSGTTLGYSGKVQIPLGYHNITYRVSDPQGNFGTAIARVYVPNPITPPAAVAGGIIVDGDEISTYAPGKYVGLFAARNPSIPITSFAVGGSTLDDIIARKPQVLAAKPKIVTLLLGYYDLQSYSSPDAYAAKLWTYTDSLRANGIKVAVASMIAVSGNMVSGSNQTKFNQLLRWAKGFHIDQMIDFGNNPRMGILVNTNPSREPDLYQMNTVQPRYNGRYPSEGVSGGHGRMAELYHMYVKEMYSPTPFTPDVLTNGNLPDIPTNITTSDWLYKSAVPSYFSNDVVGAFRFDCQPSHLGFDDPVVYPGQPGKSHLHTFFGNTETDAFSNYNSLRTRGLSTCTGGPLNRSGYWVPSVINGDGKVVLPEHITIYYKAIPKNNPLVMRGLTNPNLMHFPRGLRMVFGFNTSDQSDPLHHRLPVWDCTGTDGQPKQANSIAGLGTSCSPSQPIYGTVHSPDCWNGQLDDPKDHRSHLSYRWHNNNDGQDYCPAGYPYNLPVFTIKFRFTHLGNADYGLWKLSSDMKVNADGSVTSLPGGSTFHGDWFGAWDMPTMNTWEDSCIEGYRNSSAGNLCDGRSMSQVGGYEDQRRTIVDQPYKP